MIKWFVMHMSNYLKLFSCINKIVKFARKYSVKYLFSHFTCLTECLNLTWLVEKLGFDCGDDSKFCYAYEKLIEVIFLHEKIIILAAKYIVKVRVTLSRKVI